MADDEYGGYTVTARHLAETAGRPVSRQQVYMWHIRPGNDFPARHAMISSNGKVKSVFSLADAEMWLREYWELGPRKDVAQDSPVQ